MKSRELDTIKKRDSKTHLDPAIFTELSSENTEQILFKELLTDKRLAAAVLPVFDRRWFTSTGLSNSSAIVMGHLRHYGELPSLPVVKSALARRLETGKMQLEDVQRAVDAAETAASLDFDLSPEFKKEIVKTYIKKRAMWCVMIDNVQNIEARGTDVAEQCVARFEDVMRIALDAPDLGMDFFDDGDSASHWDRIRNPEAKIHTGWKAMDLYTNGGFWKAGRCLITMVAQAGLGKSMWMSNLAVNLLKQNYRVAVVSLEMSEDVYAQRFDAHISKNDINNLVEKEDTVRKRLKKFKKEHPDASLRIKEFPPNTMRVYEIEMWLQELVSEGKQFDAVIIDYLNLLLPNSGVHENMYSNGLEVSTELRALSYKFSVPFITATQANTEGINNADIGMQNISESRGISHPNDAIFALFQTDEDRENGVINCRILKNRFGGMVGKVIQYKLDPKTLLLEDVTALPAGYSGMTEDDARDSGIVFAHDDVLEVDEDESEKPAKTPVVKDAIDDL